MAIDHPAFPVEPWTIRETELDLDKLAQAESVFALANGHLGLRANLDEGEPAGLPGTYLGGFYEVRPLPYAEAGYGYPEDGQTVVNVTDGKVIRLLVEDEPFDIRYGRLHSHERVLDLRAGTLHRTVVWESPTGRSVRITSTRLVSFSQRAVAAIQYEVEPLHDALPVVVQSELVSNQSLPGGEQDPRAAAALQAPLVSLISDARDRRALLVHRTRASGLQLGAAMDHVITASRRCGEGIESFPDEARLTLTADLAPGRPLRMVKFLAYGWSAERSVPALRDQVAAALAGAKQTGWKGLLAEQRAYLDAFWEGADIELEGDAELQQAARFALFHILQAGARGEQRAIQAKGLTGPGYDGHTFWDTESFVLPVLTYTVPHAAADALGWRHRTLDLARERARQLGLRGAAFPWRTIGGQECSGYWPAGTAAFHINADIADAVVRYRAATGDDAFERDYGLGLLVETARLWRSLGHHDGAGRFRIDGVTGPDEYSAVCDNNVYTNLMAQRNLRAAADAAARHPRAAAALGVDEEETAGWRDAAADVFIPYDSALGIHPQAEGFTQHGRWDFAATGADQYPLLLHFPYFDLYRKQVVKQADLVLALHVCGDAFDAEHKARNFAYYEPLTVRDSSLSACTQAVVAAEVGHLDLAYDYFGEAALMDLDDLERNTRDGIHIASLAGTWIAAVAGFGGLRDHDGELSFAPRLPGALTRLTFRLAFRGRRLLVEVDQRRARYSLLEGSPLQITHHGETLTVPSDGEVTRAIPSAPSPVAPRQPPGREPARRRPPAG
ncbi:MAG: glycoside hydrolase family 65 protein [Actinomycetota bacterium]|nr:glycoside hydrolase family 65 protein [Actinomycetota bacterium]